MEINTSDKIILITGGSGGIGKEIVKYFLKEGANVISADIKEPSENNEFDSLIKKENFKFINTDITKESSVKELANIIKKDFGKIDALINNAGIIYKDYIDSIDISKWHDTINVNLTGAMLVTKEVLPLMYNSKRGTIINISSIQAFIGTEEYSAYSSSKAGLLGLTKVWAKELAQKKINVNAICPGHVKSYLTENLSKKISKEENITEKEALKRIIEKNPTNMLIEPQNISAMCAFLMSEFAINITGQSIMISGGMIMR